MAQTPARIPRPLRAGVRPVCPKCRGRLAQEPDERRGGCDWICLYCGYRAAVDAEDAP